MPYRCLIRKAKMRWNSLSSLLIYILYFHLFFYIFEFSVVYSDGCRNNLSGWTGENNLTYSSLGRRSSNFYQLVSHRSIHFPLKAVALPIEPPVDDADLQLKELSEKYGFTQIGEPVPDSITLRDIIESLPKKVLMV